MEDKNILADAIEKNGWKTYTGQLFKVKEGELRACALGQASLNLGIVTEEEVRKHPNGSLNEMVYSTLADRFGGRLVDAVWFWNDYYHQDSVDLKAIADKVRNWNA